MKFCRKKKHKLDPFPRFLVYGKDNEYFREVFICKKCGRVFQGKTKTRR